MTALGWLVLASWSLGWTVAIVLAGRLVRARRERRRLVGLLNRLLARLEADRDGVQVLSVQEAVRAIAVTAVTASVRASLPPKERP